MASAPFWRSLSSFCVAGAALQTCHIACSTLHTLHSTLHPLHFTLHTLHSTLYTPHSTLHTPHFTLHALYLILYTPHSTLYTLYFTLHTSHFTLYKRCTSNSILFTPHWPFFHVYDISLSTRFGIRTIIIRVSIRVHGLHLVFKHIMGVSINGDTPKWMVDFMENPKIQISNG